jgi:hypothetical protein
VAQVAAPRRTDRLAGARRRAFAPHGHHGRVRAWPRGVPPANRVIRPPHVLPSHLVHRRVPAPGLGVLYRHAPGHASLIHRLLFRVPRWLAHHIGAVGLLEQPAFAIVLGLAGIAGWAGWWLLRRRGRRVAPGQHPRRWPRRTLAGAATFVLLLSALAGLNAYAGYVPTVADAASLLGFGTPGVMNSVGAAIAAARTHNVVVQVSIPAPRLGMPGGRALVMLPAGYDPRRRYPVLYLLGGAPGKITDWLFAGQLQSTVGEMQQSGLIRRMIIVMPAQTPDGLVDYECLNAVDGPQVMTFLTRRVVPVIDRRFSTLTTRSGRAIGGFSAGADCALNVGLHHTGLFGAIAAIEPEGRPGVGADWVLADNPRLIWRNSPIDYLRTMAFPHHMAVYLSGLGPHGPQARLAEEFRLAGQTVVVHNESGFGHTWNDARLDEPYMLEFISAFWRGLPAPAKPGRATIAGGGARPLVHNEARPPSGTTL